MVLQEVSVRRVKWSEENNYRDLMQKYHYLGFLPKIGETIWYVAVWHNEWIGLISFSAAALKCASRDNWIGWDFRHQYDRLKLITNNSRFLILPDWHLPNLGSRILSLCQKRITKDWQETFNHPIVLIETFVDPHRFCGTIYKAANWIYLGKTKGFSRTRFGYSNKSQSQKMIFVKPLRNDSQSLLSRPILKPEFNTRGGKMTLSAEHMKSLPDFFSNIHDPRRAQGRRHNLSTILAIAAGAILCGMRGYKAIHDWAKKLGPKARSRFKCRREDGKYVVPSEYVIRDVMIRVDPDELDNALQQWNEIYGENDESLAIDGKTMCNAIDEQGRQTHIISAVGHQSKICYTQKKSVICL